VRDALYWLVKLKELGVRTREAEVWAPILAHALADWSDEEIAHFLGQVLHECVKFQYLEENLRYSASRIVQVWPSRFRSVAEAQPFANKPEALANHVYSGRMGNTQPGDGWLFRGRGPIMLTGRENYTLAEQLTGAPLLLLPELMLEPAVGGLVSAIWFKKRAAPKIPEGVGAVSVAVNGGSVGLPDRQKLTTAALAALTRTA
jgi:putative chitinase